MYLGIDFLIAADLKPSVVEVNVGLPGGAQEYDLVSRVYLGHPSDVFQRIEGISREVYGKPFKAYIHSLPFLQSLQPFKIWLDGQGPFPTALHPALRFEDKWVQYQILSSTVAMPETRIYNPQNRLEAESFLEVKKRLVLKRRLGRGGRGFQLIEKPADFPPEIAEAYGGLLQEYIDSRVDGFVFSIRSISFGGQHVCQYANLASRAHSNHGILTYVQDGNSFGLADKTFETPSFSQRSWEAEIWFGESEPSYLRHNLYEDEVARTALIIPFEVLQSIRDISVRIERLYEALDFSALPCAFFE